MSLESRALVLAEQLGLDIGALLASIGQMLQLTTTDKTSLVNAINELQTKYQAVLDLEAANNASINDAVITTENAWSADKIIAALETAKQDMIAGAPEAYDTLAEIATYLNGNDTAVANLINRLTGTVRYDVAQTLLDAEQQQACTNIGVGSKDVNARDLFLIATDTNTYVEPGYIVPGYFAG